VRQPILTADKVGHADPERLAKWQEASLVDARLKAKTRYIEGLEELLRKAYEELRTLDGCEANDSTYAEEADMVSVWQIDNAELLGQIERVLLGVREE
jgi:hypothetical protein